MLFFKQSRTVYTQSVDTSLRSFKVFCENETRWEQQDSGDCFIYQTTSAHEDLPTTEKTGADLGGGVGGAHTTLCTRMSLNVQIPAQ